MAQIKSIPLLCSIIFCVSCGESDNAAPSQVSAPSVLPPLAVEQALDLVRTNCQARFEWSRREQNIDLGIRRGHLDRRIPSLEADLGKTRNTLGSAARERTQRSLDDAKSQHNKLEEAERQAADERRHALAACEQEVRDMQARLVKHKKAMPVVSSD